MSNDDINIWNTDTKLEAKSNRPSHWNEYLEKAVRKETKPILTSELNKKRWYLRRLRVLQLLLFYVCVAGIAYNCYEEVFGGFGAEFERIYTDMVRDTNIRLVDDYKINSSGTEDVYNAKQLIHYIIKNFVIMTNTWENNKPISAQGNLWDKTRTSIPLGPTNVIIQLMSPQEGNTTILYELENYFTHPHDFYSRRTQEKKPTVYISGIEWHYQEINKLMSLRGKTDYDYPLMGHTKAFDIRNWPQYYATIRSEIEELLENTELVPRTIIFTNNYFCPNIPGISTVDLVAEILPSGVHTAKVHTFVSKMFGIRDGLLYDSWSSGPPTLVYRAVASVLTIVLLMINVFVIGKIGLNEYFSNLRWIIRALLFVCCFFNALSSAFLFNFKYTTARELLNDVDGLFTDVHKMYYISDLWDKICIGFVFFFVVMEAILTLVSLMNFKRLARVCRMCIAITFSITLIETMLVSMYELTLATQEKRSWPLTIFINLKEVLPINRLNRPYEDFLPIAIMIFTVLSKCSVAVIVQLYIAGYHLEKTDYSESQLNNTGICKHVGLLCFKPETPTRQASSHEESGEFSTPEPADTNDISSRKLKVLNKKFSPFGW